MTIRNQEEFVAKISSWFERLGLVDTACELEVYEGDGLDEPPSRDFHFRPTRQSAFSLDIRVTDEGYAGMGIMHPDHSNIVYAWGFESSCERSGFVLDIVTQIALGSAEIVVGKLGQYSGGGWLEISEEVLSKLEHSTRYKKIRYQTQARFYKKRILSSAWT